MSGDVSFRDPAGTLSGSISQTAGNTYTNQAIGPTVGATQRLWVEQLTVIPHPSNTANPVVRIGFGASTVPAAASTFVEGMLFDCQALPSSGELIGVDGKGKAGEELRITAGDPVGGGYTVMFRYRVLDAAD